MIVKRLLADLENCVAEERARGAGALAKVYLFEDLSESDLMDAETALTALLDDPVLGVRRAIARVFASSRNAPPHIIAALASDHSLVAGRVLTHSPLLNDDDLIEALGIADSYAQVAVALRPNLQSKVADAIAANGGREAMIALAVNDTAQLDHDAMMTILERHGADGEVREALLGRSDIPPEVRATIAGQTADALEKFTCNTGWLNTQRSQRCSREALDTTTIAIAVQEFATSGMLPLQIANHLRDNAQLTPSVLLRALVSGDRSLFEAALATLSNTAPRRVTGLVAAWNGAGFGALYARAGLPPRLLAAFRAALAAQDATGIILAAGDSPQLSSILIERTLAACEASASPDLRKVNALLHRLRAEALRMEARAISAEMIEEARTASHGFPAEQPKEVLDTEVLGQEILGQEILGQEMLGQEILGQVPLIDLKALEAALTPGHREMAA